MNLGDFRTAVQSKIGLNASGEQAYIDAWVNRGVVDVLRKTSCFVTPATMNLTAASADYALPTMLEMEYIYITSTDNLQRLLTRLSPAALLAYRMNSLVQQVPRYYATQGSNVLMVYPTPANADTLTIYYTPRPANGLTASSHDPSQTAYGGIPTEFHDAIELYALAQASDYDDDQTGGQGTRYLQMYDARIRQIRREVTRGAGGAKLAAGQIWAARRYRLPNSYDVGRR